MRRKVLGPAQSQWVIQDAELASAGAPLSREKGQKQQWPRSWHKPLRLGLGQLLERAKGNCLLGRKRSTPAQTH